MSLHRLSWPAIRTKAVLLQQSAALADQLALSSSAFSPLRRATAATAATYTARFRHCTGSRHLSTYTLSPRPAPGASPAFAPATATTSARRPPPSRPASITITTAKRHQSSASSPSATSTSTSTTTTTTMAPADGEPTGLIATKGIELLTFPTPNGYKASILLEELKEAYGRDYTVQTVNIIKNTQKEPWFLAVNPNGRIPAIVDHDRGRFPVFEGAAILQYLTKHYDPEHRFSFPYDSDDYSVAEQWIAWQHGGIGPMQGQAGIFVRRAAEDNIPFAIQRYVGETERLYGVLDAHLEGRDWIVGPGRGKYSIADISLLGWANSARGVGVDRSQFKNVDAWFERAYARPATKRGFEVPYASPFAGTAIAKKIAEGDKETIEKDKATFKVVKEAKDKFNYVYKSP